MSDVTSFLCCIRNVLVNHHNGLLDTIQKELNSEDNSQHSLILKNLVNDLSSKKVSIIQIARDNNGVISLNNNDCLWIERIAEASLITDDDNAYFQKIDSQLNFDYRYVQSYLIRTYLLSSPINYDHIHTKYTCHIHKTQIKLTTNNTYEIGEEYSIPLNENDLETRWNHLSEMMLDKLYQCLIIIKRLSLMLEDQVKQNEELNLSKMYAYEFFERYSLEENQKEQLEQLDIKDFQLCYINSIRMLYEKNISGFEHLFSDMPQLLRMPITEELNNEINQMFQNVLDSDYTTTDVIQSSIQTITDLLNDLKEIEYFLLQQSTQSLAETCQIMAISNPLLSLIPNGIKCENYLYISILLTRQRSKLQELLINLEEKQAKMQTELWSESFVKKEEHEPVKNRFQQYLNEEEQQQQPILLQTTATAPTEQNLIFWDTFDDRATLDLLCQIDVPTTMMDDDLNERNISNITDGNGEEHNDPSIIDPNIFKKYGVTTNLLNTSPKTTDDRHEHLSLFELRLQSVPLSSCLLIKKIMEKQQETLLPPVTKAQKFILKFDDASKKPVSSLRKLDKVHEFLKKSFDEQKYDVTTHFVVDSDQIVVDFNQIIQKQTLLEYQVIQRSSLINVSIRYKRDSLHYEAKSDTNISTIVLRFIEDVNITTMFYLIDQLGKCIECEPINRMHRGNNDTIYLTVVEDVNDDLCQITARSKQEVFAYDKLKQQDSRGGDHYAESCGTDSTRIRLYIADKLYFASSVLLPLSTEKIKKVTRRSCVAQLHIADIIPLNIRGNEHPQLFSPSTKFQQIGEWLMTIPVTEIADSINYQFWNRNQKCLVEIVDTISSILKESKNELVTTEEHQFVYVDGVSVDDLIKVKFEYESNSYCIGTLKPTLISDLLYNEQTLKYLKIQTSPTDCVLVLDNGTENEEQILQGQEDFQQPVSKYLSSNSQLNFRISTLITIERYIEKTITQKPISNRNVTIEQILTLVLKVNDHYLASTTTMEILDSHQLLSNINETKFYLLKENETCSVSINTPKTEQLIVIDDNDQPSHY
ncbi:unnamed protein product, partial [Didymodactylos carnosus]